MYRDNGQCVKHFWHICTSLTFIENSQCLYVTKILLDYKSGSLKDKLNVDEISRRTMCHFKKTLHYFRMNTFCWTQLYISFSLGMFGLSKLLLGKLLQTVYVNLHEGDPDLFDLLQDQKQTTINHSNVVFRQSTCIQHTVLDTAFEGIMGIKYYGLSIDNFSSILVM